MLNCYGYWRQNGFANSFRTSSGRSPVRIWRIARALSPTPRGGGLARATWRKAENAGTARQGFSGWQIADIEPNGAALAFRHAGSRPVRDRPAPGSHSGAEAAAIAARLRTEFPGFSIEGFISGYPVTNPGAARAIRDAAKLVPIR
ncbi:hypothetical protein ACWGS9_22610 [Bradyrhizobium sp. Arg314]